MGKSNLTRILPGYDANWQQKWQTAHDRYKTLLNQPGALTAEEREELLSAMQRMEVAANSRFRTTAAYRDHHFHRVQQLLDEHGVAFELPSLSNHATLEEIDTWLERAHRAIEINMTENF
uniref:Uncharacterized protein n=1 Tax=Magnetococcus massalia (strain MO-1) TaxID=451514 RepID=A0A1S7LFI8_MAGMO|nr:conserved protein of unknown function [Candidatus Magnetococcus massalia]